MLEIEKKYLLNDIPNLSQIPYDEIEQGYLSFTPEIRIRKKGNKYYITKKGEGTEAREEIETEIDSITYNILSSLVNGRVIKKTRYRISLNYSLIAELDIYHEDLEGLVTFETEFPNEIEAKNFIAPVWFGEEITEDKRFKNKNLARMEKIDFYKEEKIHKLKKDNY